MINSKNSFDSVRLHDLYVRLRVQDSPHNRSSKVGVITLNKLNTENLSLPYELTVYENDLDEIISVLQAMKQSLSGS
jgi:hypothetical protein